MGEKFTDLFPLSIFSDMLGVEAAQRQRLAEIILADEQRKPAPADEETAWLGDTAGHEFLFDVPEFETLFELIAASVKDYATGIGMQTDRLLTTTTVQKLRCHKKPDPPRRTSALVLHQLYSTYLDMTPGH